MTSLAPGASERDVTVRGISTRCSSPAQVFAGRLRTGAGETVSFAGALMVRARRGRAPRPLGNPPKVRQQLKVARFEFDQQLGPPRSRTTSRATQRSRHRAGQGPQDRRHIRRHFDRIIDEDPTASAGWRRLQRAALQLLRDEWLRTRSLNASLAWMSAFELTHHQMTTLITRYGLV